MSGDDDRSWLDGDKLSFSERDRRRREGHSNSSGDSRPRGGAARARADEASKNYLKAIDGMFSKTKGGAEVEKLGAAVRKAHGSEGLAQACHAYREAAGFPVNASLLGMFLDSGDTELIVGGLQTIGAARKSGDLEVSSGLLSQIRMLSEDPDDEIAETAEDLLEEL